jgi:hypothetical protein
MFSNLKSQISNLKSQISDASSQLKEFYRQAKIEFNEAPRAQAYGSAAALVAAAFAFVAVEIVTFGGPNLVPALPGMGMFAGLVSGAMTIEDLIKGNRSPRGLAGTAAKGAAATVGILLALPGVIAGTLAAGPAFVLGAIVGKGHDLISGRRPPRGPGGASGSSPALIHT